jgi:hypothetical protein
LFVEERLSDVAGRRLSEDRVNNWVRSRPVLQHGAALARSVVMSVSTAVPDFFTLPEAGRILRIGRNSAYRLAAEYERTGGESGLPFVRLGKLKRVPRVALEKLHGGPITWPLDDEHQPALTVQCTACATFSRPTGTTSSSTRVTETSALLTGDSQPGHRN